MRRFRTAQPNLEPWCELNDGKVSRLCEVADEMEPAAILVFARRRCGEVVRLGFLNRVHTDPAQERDEA